MDAREGRLQHPEDEVPAARARPVGPEAARVEVSESLATVWTDHRFSRGIDRTPAEPCLNPTAGTISTVGWDLHHRRDQIEVAIGETTDVVGG